MTKSQAHELDPALDESREPRRASGVQRVARRSARADLELAIRFDAAGETHLGTARNMSLGGMFVATDAPAPFGATIEVELDLGLERVTKVRCFVRWTNADGMGVQFDVMGARETHALTTMLTGSRL